MNKEILSRFVLGTANFLNSYGFISSRVNERAVKYILDAAKDHGITKLDTAKGYGDVENLLIEKYADKFEITTKLSVDNKFDVLKEVNRYSKLNHGNVLVHNYRILESKKGVDLAVETLKKISDENKKLSVGFSVYEDRHVDLINLDSYVLQIPHNKFINRFADLISGQKQAKKLQIRSIFLQGIIFKNKKELLKLPRELMISIELLRKICQDMNISLTDFCVFYSLECGRSIEVVAGVSSYSQFKDIMKSLQRYEEFKKNGQNFDFLNKAFETGDWADPRSWES